MRHLYIHVPFCRSKCAYCAFYSTTVGPPADFFSNLIRELRLRLPAAVPETVYLGGGTPTALGVQQLAVLAQALRRMWPGDCFRPAEWTVETTPVLLTPELARQLRRDGVTRLSIGAQSFDDATLQLLGRSHRADDVHSALQNARAAGFDNLGLDLIAAVPGVTPAIWRKTIETALSLEPQHISVYTLSLEPGTPLAKAVAAGRFEMPSDDDQLAALDLAEEMLTSVGYERYEISNYARPGYACQHNLAVWRGEDFLGLGPAASSRESLRRRTNHPDLQAWSGALQQGKPPPADEEILTAAEDRNERLLTGLRLAEGMCPDSSAIGLYQQKKLTQLAGLGLVRQTADQRWSLTRRGREVADSVARELLPED